MPLGPGACHCQLLLIDAHQAWPAAASATRIATHSSDMASIPCGTSSAPWSAPTWCGPPLDGDVHQVQSAIGIVLLCAIARTWCCSSSSCCVPVSHRQGLLSAQLRQALQDPTYNFSDPGSGMPCDIAACHNLCHAASSMIAATKCQRRTPTCTSAAPESGMPCDIATYHNQFHAAGSKMVATICQRRTSACTSPAPGSGMPFEIGSSTSCCWGCCHTSGS